MSKQADDDGIHAPVFSGGGWTPPSEMLLRGPKPDPAATPSFDTAVFYTAYMEGGHKVGYLPEADGKFLIEYMHGTAPLVVDARRMFDLLGVEVHVRPDKVVALLKSTPESRQATQAWREAENAFWYARERQIQEEARAMVEATTRAMKDQAEGDWRP